MEMQPLELQFEERNTLEDLIATKERSTEGVQKKLELKRAKAESLREDIEKLVLAGKNVSKKMIDSVTVSKKLICWSRCSVVKRIRNVSSWYVFDIKSYRLIVKIQFVSKLVFVRRVVTHPEYDKIKNIDEV